jgi:hypothetical protein
VGESVRVHTLERTLHTIYTKYNMLTLRSTMERSGGERKEERKEEKEGAVVERSGRRMNRPISHAMHCILSDFEDFDNGGLFVIK